MLYLLLGRDRTNAEFLSDALEISKRSVYRYIDVLSLAHVPITNERGRKGGFFIAESYKLPANFLTKEETAVVLSALKSYNADIPSEQLSKAIEKLSIRGSSGESNMSVSSGNLIIDDSSWGSTDANNNMIKVLGKAVNESYLTEINYHDRNGNSSVRIVEPHRLVLKQGLWYLYAYCRTKRDFRLFKIGRIEYADVKNEKFDKREIEKDFLRFEKWRENSETVEIDLKIEKCMRSDVEEWLGADSLTVKSDGSCFAHAKLPYDRGLITKILGYGKDVTVLAPDKLKKDLFIAVSDIYGKYNIT